MSLNRYTLSLAAAAALHATASHAADPVRVGDCSILQDEYVATAAAKERFGKLAGNCEGIYDIDGVRYARTEMVVRSNRMSTLQLYLPVADKTISVKPDPTRRVYLNGRKTFVGDLQAGDDIEMYVQVDKFFEAKVDEVAFVAADEAPEEVHVHEAAPVVALPTTASPLPALALFSGLLVAAAGLVRVLRRKA